MHMTMYSFIAFELYDDDEKNENLFFSSAAAAAATKPKKPPMESGCQQILGRF